MVEHELQALVEEEVGRVQRGQARAHGGQQRGGLLERRQRDERRDAAGQPGHEPPAHARDDAQGALAADQQRREVVARVVLQQRGPVDDRPVGEDRLQPGDARADRPVAHRVRAAGVGGDEAADGGAVAPAEVDAGVEAGVARVGLQRGEGDARPGLDLRGRAVDGPQVGEARGAEDDLAAARHARADHAGVAALRHDRRAVRAAGGEHGDDLGGVRRPHHGARPAVVAPRPVDLEGRAEVVVGQHVGGAEGGGEILHEAVGHSRHATVASRV